MAGGARVLAWFLGNRGKLEASTESAETVEEGDQLAAGGVMQPGSGSLLLGEWIRLWHGPELTARGIRLVRDGTSLSDQSAAV
jgi:hypothetical protein